METNLHCTFCGVAPRCGVAFFTQRSVKSGKEQNMQEPKLMFIKGRIFLKTFYEIPYLD